MTMSRVEAYYLTEHEDDPMLLDTPEDVDTLIDLLSAEEIASRMAALYSLERPLTPADVPDHELYVGVNGDLEVGALSFMDATGNWATRGPACNGTDVRYCIMGSETEFPPDANIPLGLLRQAVKEFLTSDGQRPTCVVWQEHDV